MQSDRHARISDRAYHIWLAEGRVHGRDPEHWRQAEREIAEEEAKAAAAMAARAGKSASPRRATVAAPRPATTRRPTTRTRSKPPAS